ncbi:GNAT family N-acetyltransferase [Cocleimonas sp. KMM 6892]|uniref:GNAT family N-acetyltransferase n=1 Tax=unclassified Cocleimonas TaxID=2639732 RepID=UPI002DB9DD11|nr:MULTISPECIES: GNAT family N-acetyltransferase [unclassified Cocleimonas]MEB8430945.1 GNAT family N-acetyltransferase [Cocleimonas sp. KMM 6892]MEC4714283.1 GNAT family N-acetyltransferase [Cocleimonas sp. KMM 6895]MEC4743614.1 GNAT family N-acetyltransferase [Cocleimonas sp. KMM 6896]
MIIYSKDCQQFEDDELRAIANLHYQCINLGFLSKLGVNFLFYLYKSMSLSDDVVVVIAKDQDKIIGFITGTQGRFSGVYKHLIKKHLVPVSLILIPRLLRFSNFKKIIEILFYTKGKNDLSDLPKAELLSLAVAKEHRGSGVSQQLFIMLAEHFKEIKIQKFKIVVGEELIGAQKFYEKMGAARERVLEVHSGNSSVIYSVDVKS